MINITFYFYRFLDSLCSLEMTVLHLAWISRLALLARNDRCCISLGFLDSLRSLEMTVLHLAWISRLALLARNDSVASRLDFSTRFARSK